MIRLVKIYKKDLLAIFLICLSFIVSSILVISAYSQNIELKNKKKLLLQQQAIYKEVKLFLPKYKALKVQFHDFQYLREAEIQQNIELLHFSETLQKITDSYLKNGFLFLEKLELLKCQGLQKEEATLGENCLPSLALEGKKVIF